MQTIITNIVNGKTSPANFDFSGLSSNDHKTLIDTLLVAKLTLLGCGLYTSEYERRVEAFSEALIKSLVEGI